MNVILCSCRTKFSQSIHPNLLYSPKNFLFSCLIPQLKLQTEMNLYISSSAIEILEPKNLADSIIMYRIRIMINIK